MKRLSITVPNDVYMKLYEMRKHQAVNVSRFIANLIKRELGIKKGEEKTND